MKIEISKDWCLRMAQRESDAEIGAGRLAIDPVFDGERIPADVAEEEGPNVAFGRFVNLMRRQQGMSLEQLAVDADVNMADLVEAESDPYHRPELRTACQLANYFKVPEAGLMQVAGLAAPKDARLFDEGVRFAARSESTAELTPEEGAALEAFVAVLSGQK
jgi:transcriptional regulator with XRE-family HTH domain